MFILCQAENIGVVQQSASGNKNGKTRKFFITFIDTKTG